MRAMGRAVRLCANGRVLARLRRATSSTPSTRAGRFRSTASSLRLESATSARPTRGALRAISATGGIGRVVAEASADFFAEPRNEAALDALNKEVTIEPMEAVAAGHPLAGQTLVFTGSVEKMTRA